MKNQELYSKTVNILEQAYLKNELMHGDCTACAVGNLIKNSGVDCYKTVSELKVAMDAGAEYVSDLDKPFIIMWKQVFHTSENKLFQSLLGGKSMKFQKINSDNYKGFAKQLIDATGYTWQELAQIENAFEMADEGESEDEYMFNGLVAVIDSLDKIHENTDEVITKQSKAKFVKELA
jgi:hypothetical protein